jgi:superfamily II RNA helicase
MESVALNASHAARSQAKAVRETAKQQIQPTNGNKKPSTLDQSSKACTHNVALPEGYKGPSAELDTKIYGTSSPELWLARSHIRIKNTMHFLLVAGTLDEPRYPVERYVKTYPFELDPFQAYSVACVVRF